MSSRIISLKAREILDSRGFPTVEAELKTREGIFTASVPSGVSRGQYEALELRDHGKRYLGKGVLKAVKNVNKIIGPKLKGKDVVLQKELDELMINLDGTKNKSRLGANAVLAASMAVCRAGAGARKLPLWKWIAKLAGTRPVLPTPSVLLIEGGLHAGNKLDIQEFMIAPLFGRYAEKLRQAAEVYHNLKLILAKKYGENATNVGCEGGFAPPVQKTEEALKLMLKAINQAGYKNKTKFCLDVAASSFLKNGIYKFEGRSLTAEELLKFYSRLLQKYPFLSIEDPFAEEDWEGFRAITQKWGKKAVIIGDDFLVTNLEKVKKALDQKACNGLLLKLNQIGTVSETLEVAKFAMKNGWQVMVSQRGGETCDSFYADLCVGLGTGWIKTGAPNRGERVAKYNRLLQIESEIKS